jgi:hypothetical protein
MSASIDIARLRGKASKELLRDLAARDLTADDLDRYFNEDVDAVPAIPELNRLKRSKGVRKVSRSPEVTIFQLQKAQVRRLARSLETALARRVKKLDRGTRPEFDRLADLLCLCRTAGGELFVLEY